MEDRLDQLVRSHKREFAVSARGVEVAEAFDLSLPVGLVLEGKAVTTSLGGLPTHLPTSSAASSELFERFLLLRAEQGFEAAWETLANGPEGEEWARVWDEVVADRKGGAVLTADQLTGLVVKARAGFLRSPKELLVVSLEDGGSVVSTLCEAGWFLR
ncbi:hypothetical protein CB0101_11425 [Synechococcus sp. CB0101]|uniref:hypothetical protein n=1 Tax=Synechococcus sp. CB0101 TaxID=232348 RepID=UPI0010C5979D|nr:hypothetical protein [Synechococcus sp. CB0101]QCH15451.1 hypothetical protein CB0101_11425 [Synechococcus sp. CB0101]